MIRTDEALDVRGPTSQRLTHLFNVTLQFTSDSPAAAVVSSDGREGAYIGSGEGRVRGERLRGLDLMVAVRRRLPLSAHSQGRAGS